MSTVKDGHLIALITFWSSTILENPRASANFSVKRTACSSASLIEMTLDNTHNNYIATKKNSKKQREIQHEGTSGPQKLLPNLRGQKFSLEELNMLLTNEIAQRALDKFPLIEVSFLTFQIIHHRART